MKHIIWINGMCTKETDAFASHAVKDQKACYISKGVYKEYMKLSNSEEAKAPMQLRVLKNKHLRI